MTAKTKFLILILSITALVQSGYLLHVMATLDGTRKTVTLLRENIGLHVSYQALAEKYHEKVDEFCALRSKMGDAYRVVLGNLVRDLGLEERPASVGMNVLSRIDFGIGGPEP
jgi:hypothetical protein